MSLQERTYSVLIASASVKFNDAASAILSESGCSPVSFASDLSSAKRFFGEYTYDFVIINSPLPDDAGIRFAIDVCRGTSSGALLLVASDIHDQIRDRVTEHGVFTLPKPVVKSTFSLALGWMESSRERTRKIMKSSLSLEEKMEEIRLVNRAKWLLIHEFGMDEPTAHKYIGKQAMDHSQTKADVARQIIRMYS